MASDPPGPPDGTVTLRRAELARLLSTLGASQVDLVSEFAHQILRCHDPDAVATFLRWRRDPRIETLLLIAAELEDEALDELIFAAEDLQDERLPRPSPARPGAVPPQRR